MDSQIEIIGLLEQIKEKDDTIHELRNLVEAQDREIAGLKAEITRLGPIVKR